MVETLKRMRHKVAWLVVGLALLQLLLAPGRLIYLAQSGQYGWPEAARASGNGLGIALLVAMTAAVAACSLIAPVGPAATKVARAAAGVAWLAAGYSLASLVLVQARGVSMGAFFVVIDVLGGLIDVALKVLAAVLLHKMAGHGPTATVSQAERPKVEQPADEKPRPEQAPSWSADQAVGAVWARAGDAASGAAASTWGQSGQASRGWQPASQPALGATRSAELPSADPAGGGEASPSKPRGPWATAGEQAAGAPVPEGSASIQVDGPRSWAPAPRDAASAPDQPEREG